jgi:hypothetical protein
MTRECTMRLQPAPCRPERRIFPGPDKLLFVEMRKPLGLDVTALLSVLLISESRSASGILNSYRLKPVGLVATESRLKENRGARTLRATSASAADTRCRSKKLVSRKSRHGTLRACATSIFQQRLLEWTDWRLVNVNPDRRIGNPFPHRRWSIRVTQLRLHGGWKDHLLE